MNKIEEAIKDGRLVFYRNGSYKYVPTNRAIQKIEEHKKSFNSERAKNIHQIKIMNRKKVWKETNNQLEKIEENLKGLVRITDQKFIYS